MNVSVILVEPKYPGNIGAVARACMNFGCKNLILINPVDYLVDEAFMFATHGKQLLYDAQVFSSLEECLDKHHVLVGTTRRRREKQVPFFDPKTLFSVEGPLSKGALFGEAGELNAGSASKELQGGSRAGCLNVGLVFGREDSGLTNEELNFCNVQASLTGVEGHDVFNLSQAVLLFLYEWFQAQNLAARGVSKTSDYNWTLANKREESSLYAKLANMLDVLPIDTRKGVDNFTGLFKRVLGRAVLEKRDVRLFHKLFDLVLFQHGVKKSRLDSNKKNAVLDDDL